MLPRHAVDAALERTTYFPPFFRLLPVFFEAPPPPSAQDTCFFVARGGDPGGIKADFGEGGGCGTTMKARIVWGERLLQAPSGISPMTRPFSTQAFWNFASVRAAFGVDASSETIKALAWRCRANKETSVCNNGSCNAALYVQSHAKIRSPIKSAGRGSRQSRHLALIRV